MTWKGTPLAALLALCLAAGPAISADPQGTDYTGDWTGNGDMATGLDAPLQRGRCRVTVTSPDAGDELRMEGTCAVAAGRSRFVLRTLWLPDGRVRAGFRAQGMDDTVIYTGTRNGRTIRLSAMAELPDGAGTIHSRLTMDFTGPDRFTVREWQRATRGGTEKETLFLVFERPPPQE